MTQAMRRATRELCTGICRGRGPQAFAPTGLVTGLVQCRYCRLIRRAAPEPSAVSHPRPRDLPHGRQQARQDELGAHPSSVWTIGYEGRALPQFLALLQEGGIQVVVDVRAHAFSRVADYCEERLRRAVLDADMNYLHLSSLGSPPALRQQLERTGNYPMFFAAYHAYLAEYAQAKATLAQLAELARERRLCLLCRERDPHRCHRSVLAEQLSALVGQPVEHL